jgi:flagellar protein FliL
MANDDKGENLSGSDGEGDDATEGEAQVDAKKAGKKKLIMIAGAALLLLLLGGGAAFYFLGGSSLFGGKPAAEDAANPTEPPKIAYYDLPDLIVNIQTAEGAPAYLKVSLSLELVDEQEKASIDALSPRIVDQLQGYLRELRVDDLKGSAGIMRLKEELLRRATVAVAPYRIRDVLLKEMVVQ